jgi:two-component system CheB/CheR fusion protein
MARKDNKTSADRPKPPISSSASAAQSGAIFPIVGIGASAGGLHALERMFAALPEKPGAAFVVIQHLDPTRASLTSEILSRHSKIPFVEVHDTPHVEANTAYVIPPGKYLSIANGNLQLTEPDKPRGARMAVDYFCARLRTISATAPSL